MAYSFAHRGLLTSSMLLLDPEVLTDTAADHVEWAPGMRITVTEFGFIVSTTIAGDTTAPVVSLDHRTVVGGGTRTEKGVLTLADATAAGSVVQSTRPNTGQTSATFGMQPFVVEPGESIVFEHKTAAADSGTNAGQGFYFIVYEEAPDAIGNRTVWTEVAS